MAGGDKAASGTLQMQALAEWRLDGEQGKLRPLIMLPMFTAATQEWGICSAVKRLQTSTDLYRHNKPVSAQAPNDLIFLMLSILCHVGSLEATGKSKVKGKNGMVPHKIPLLYFSANYSVLKYSCLIKYSL